MKEKQEKLMFEKVSRCLHKMLVDAAAAEYHFSSEFFESPEVFTAVFSPIITMFDVRTARF